MPSNSPPPGKRALGDTDHVPTADTGWAKATAATRAHAPRPARRFMTVVRLGAQMGLPNRALWSDRLVEGSRRLCSPASGGSRQLGGAGVVYARPWGQRSAVDIRRPRPGDVAVVDRRAAAGQAEVGGGRVHPERIGDQGRRNEGRLPRGRPIRGPVDIVLIGEGGVGNEDLAVNPK